MNNIDSMNDSSTVAAAPAALRIPRAMRVVVDAARAETMLDVSAARVALARESVAYAARQAILTDESTGPAPVVCLTLSPESCDWADDADCATRGVTR